MHILRCCWCVDRMVASIWYSTLPVTRSGSTLSSQLATQPQVCIMCVMCIMCIMCIMCSQDLPMKCPPTVPTLTTGENHHECIMSPVLYQVGLLQWFWLAEFIWGGDPVLCGHWCLLLQCQDLLHTHQHHQPLLPGILSSDWLTPSNTDIWLVYYSQEVRHSFGVYSSVGVSNGRYLYQLPGLDRYLCYHGVP